MKVLQVDYDFCEGCWTCEHLLSGFREEHGGTLYISDPNYEREDVRAACLDLVNRCPREAISLREVTVN